MRTNRLFGLLIACLFSTSLVAQIDIVPRFGVHASGLDAKLADFKTEASTGWNAGIDLQLGRGMVYLQPGAHYHRFNADLTSNPDIEGALELKGKTTISQIKTPLNLGVRLTGEDGLIDVYALGGVVPTFLMGVQESETFAFDEGDLNDFTWGTNVGLGLNVWFLNLDVRYEWGLTDFLVDSSAKNNVFTATVGVRF
ncbi:MAG: outer membrane beta-barrel protein [Saprospiraceae bacterium]|nr:outer membrane beta-barrel protein [Saprospiraceae bacterium]